MFLSTLKAILSFAWKVGKWPLIIICAIVLIFFIVSFVYLFIYKFIKKMEPVNPLGEHYKVKKKNLFYRVFIMAPRQFALDKMRQDPEFFKYQGVICYVGRQGSGKTVSLVHDTRNIQIEYPKCKVIGNLGYKYTDTDLKHWRQLTDYKNGKQGVIVQIDEMQNWFNSKQSKNFPPEMLQVITQNRKNRRVVFGTAQNFYMLSKDIRSQCTEIRAPVTLAGVLTIVRRYEPIINSDGEVEKKKFKGIYCFVHTDDLRNSYDTYKVINSLSSSGFVDRSEQLSAFNDNKDSDVSISIDKKLLKNKKR